MAAVVVPVIVLLGDGHSRCVDKYKRVVLDSSIMFHRLLMKLLTLDGSPNIIPDFHGGRKCRGSTSPFLLPSLEIRKTMPMTMTDTRYG